MRFQTGSTSSRAEWSRARGECQNRAVNWAVYADLERSLTRDEQHAVFDALDAIVPDSGCVGPNRKGIYEVYFTVDAATRAEAETAAAQFMKAVLQQARVAVLFVLEVTALK